MKNGNLTCSCCGAILERDNYHKFEEKIYCTDCLEEKTVVCMNCNERIWREDAEGNSNLVLCRHCYDYNYTNCEDCGRLIHNDSAYYENDDSDYPYCYDCYQKLISGAIRNYSYKPEPIFYGSGNLFFGIELEIEICFHAIHMADLEMENMSWSDFVQKILPKKAELIEYLKQKRLYVNEILNEAEE